MRQNLLETYSRQLKVAEAYVAKNFDGKTVSANTQLTTAVLLDNANRFLTESMSLDNSINPVTRGDLGAWKKFCLNLTNIAVPSLIANDLVIVHPMTSFSGSVAYLEYVAKDTKGGVKEGDVLNSVFGFGANDEGRMNYTSQIVVEEGDAPSMDVVEGGLTYIAEDGVDVKTATKKFILEDGTVAYDTIPEGKTAKKVAYVAKQWQMSSIPADRIPTIGPRMKRIPLVAEPRRIAVRYDQITAFQA